MFTIGHYTRLTQTALFVLFQRQGLAVLPHTQEPPEQQGLQLCITILALTEAASANLILK